jgi:AcrR family transcriptional regulator
MPYPAGHRDRTRERIVRSARTLFNRHGFSEVSIEDVMARAGLTRGGFYSYFETKRSLYAEAIMHAMREPPVVRCPGTRVDFATVDAAHQIINAYLSCEHFEDIDGSCPLVALPSDVSRSDPTVKRAFESVFQGMVGLFEKGLGEGDGKGRDLSLAIASLCVGGMVVARSLENRELADALRDATKRVALRLAGWHQPNRQKLASEQAKVKA